MTAMRQTAAARDEALRDMRLYRETSARRDEFIRAAHAAGITNIRQIAKEMGITRDTVYKVLRAAAMEDVTVCSPCDQGARHPGSHAEGARYLLGDEAGFPGDNEAPIAGNLARTVRGLGVTGPVTVHRGPLVSLRGYSWTVTQP